MKTKHVLIDYENVQPRNLAMLNGQPFKVLVVVGAYQAKVPFELASSLQAPGDSAEYVKIGGNGSNALDFHIAFYFGQLAEIPLLRISNTTTAEEKIEAIVKSLAARDHARPRKVKTLANTINSLFMKTLQEAGLLGLIEEMRLRYLIVIEKGNASYRPPVSQPCSWIRTVRADHRKASRIAASRLLRHQ